METINTVFHHNITSSSYSSSSSSTINPLIEHIVVPTGTCNNFKTGTISNPTPGASADAPDAPFRTSMSSCKWLSHCLPWNLEPTKSPTRDWQTLFAGARKKDYVRLSVSFITKMFVELLK